MAELFKLANPRQLMRLRNTYCLLKSLYPNKYAPLSASETKVAERYPEAENNLLMMLFWLEYSLPLAPEKIMECAALEGGEAR